MPGSPRLISRVVMVTGCSSGIGRATALHLAGLGWEVFATARRREAILDLEAFGCRTLRLDVTDERSMCDAVCAVEEAEGAVGVLVNNAGYSQSGAVEAVPLDRVRAQFETNLFGAIRLAQLVLPGMRAQRWGRIVNVSSMGGRLVFPGGGIYHASKYALEAVSDALRFEVQAFGIGVVVVEPGLIRTRFCDAAVDTMTCVADESPYAAFHDAVARATKESYAKGLFARLAGAPEDVARTIARALAARRPRARYTVAPSAKLLIAQRRVLPDRAWDRLLRTTYPVPGDDVPH